MKQNRRLILSIVWIVLGIALFGLGLAGVVGEYWSGMGSALAVVGVLKLIQYNRLNRNEAYREKIEVELTDERKGFIRSKAWAWAGYLFILITAVLSIVFRMMGQDLLSSASGYAVCLMLILYWISYLVLCKKY